ncbi:hypothetical protein [Chroococcus sp. FPU101]|uniref:DUF6929 family protein n=1 Tax=Chroococcus sp. FPU101 TaxID=1974212 RepID=UPI001A8C93E5|nr:hypothetical protein [Chroococcus sp. FPU101]GFE71269.1 hypothetical protein CFPU101_38790 [Chroococcus sp. FPU101]
MVALKRAVRDPSLQATVLNTTPLFYSLGADLSIDRSAHVRAGSSLSWFGDFLAIVQDDANFLVLINPSDLQVNAIVLNTGEDGLREFDDLRGNKKFKLDLEACTTIPTTNGDLLLAFGSGSTSRREQILIVTEQEPNSFILKQASAFYQLLRDGTDFSGSELNIEGVIFYNNHIRLFNRGNGAIRGNLVPINATCELDWNEFNAYLQNINLQPPKIKNICQYDLGELNGLSLSFTDATATKNGIIFSATAENSPDATKDGFVSGSVLGILEDTPRWIELRNLDGSLFTLKVEGVCLSKKSKNRLYLVIDADNPILPCKLCEIEITGEWRV